MLDHQNFAHPIEASGDILARLKATLDSPRLPDRLRRSGQALAERLAAPVRLSFMGLPGVGKTTVIQALLGVEVPGLIPEADGDCPTYALAHGPHMRGYVTFDDGSRHELEGPDLPGAFAKGAVYAEIHLPCDALRDIRVLELVTDGSVGELSIAAPWAAERSDIPIWCSQEFSQVEASIWAQVPERFKDHSILVLTQADRLPPSQITEWIESAHGIADAGFSIIVPVAAKQAFEAHIAGSSDADRIIAACGVRALWREILQRVDQGRQADLEHAELFLRRFERPRSRILTKPVDVIEKIGTDRPKSTVFSDAHAYLCQQAGEMLLDIEEFGPFAQGQIVERCLEAANHLVDLLADDATATPQAMLAHDAVSDAADMLLLMTLENTEGAAEDAVQLMLQVQREVALAL